MSAAGLNVAAQHIGEAKVREVACAAVRELVLL